MIDFRIPEFSKDDILAKYNTIVSREHAIMETEEAFRKRYDKGIPIYVDESYYVYERNVSKVTEENASHWAKWREVHYYQLRKDPETGEQIYYMEGGRYE